MRYLIFLILLFPIMSNAQSKWSIGLMASPDISNTSKGRKLVRTTHLGYEIGIGLYKRLSNSFYINSGLTIAKRRFDVDHYYSYYDVNTQKIDSSVVVKTSSNWTDLNVPLLLNYRLPLSKKFSITSSAGLVFCWAIKDTFRIWADGKTDNTGSSKGRKGLDRLYGSYGLGGLYNINEKFTLIVMPNAMLDVMQGDFYYSYNLRTTLLYNFK